MSKKEVRKKVYIHYGSKRFEPDKFNQVKNINFVKPEGGFWGSRITKEQPNGDWKEWADANNFENGVGEKYADGNCFKFQLKKGAKVLTIRNSEELEILPKIDNMASLYASFVMLDFEKIAKKYDAMEVLISEDYERNIGEGLYWDLYGWDCNSLLVFNKDIIKEVG